MTAWTTVKVMPRFHESFSFNKNDVAKSRGISVFSFNVYTVLLRFMGIFKPG